MSSASAFNTTCWTLILDAAKTSEIQSRPALEALCTTYWEPLYAYTRSCGKTHQDAQDTTQAFFEHLLEKNLPGRVTPGLGRFRSFLLTSLRNFMIAEHRNANRLKRGGESGPHLPLEDAYDLPATPSEAETAFDRQWAHTLIQLALDQLAAQQMEIGNSARFAVLRPLLLEPERGAAAQTALASHLDMSEGSIRTALSRLRSTFRDIVRQQVSCIVDDPAEVDDEITHLLCSLR